MAESSEYGFADVVLPVPVDRAFTYAVPAALAGRVRVGMRVLAPVRNRLDTGFVVALRDTCDVDGVKAILDAPDQFPVFAPDLLKLCRWMADYYCCSWGEALQCAVPAGLRIGSTMRYRLEPGELSTARVTDRQRRVIAELYRRGPRTEGQLATAVGRAALSNALQSLVRRGLLVAEPVVSAGGASIHTETHAVLREDRVPGNEELAAMQRRAPKQAAVYFDLLYGEPEQAVSLIYDKHKTTAATVKSLERRGLIRCVQREIYRSPHGDADAASAQKHALNEGQRHAYDAIAAALDAGAFHTYLLHGITGSGKTEVYLQAIERALGRDRDAILLVPEISLTPQTVGRFRGRFQDAVAVLHSGLSVGERYDEWRRAQRGEVRIVVGARSAVFAPLKNLGIVIVDEEHDTSYKQGETPRYHARDVAIMRAQMNDAVCVLGSATPSVEAYHNTERGKFTRLPLDIRATAGALPEVQLIDLRREAKEAAGQIILSRVLEDAIRERLAEREQVILLLNRRGFAPHVLCPQCGWVAQCPNCEVSMTYHSHGTALRCHYCNATRQRPEICDECHFNPLIYLGLGTQRAEDYLERAFSGSRVVRMDSDTTAGKGGHAKILGRFAAGDIDILIGTQMLAKGHDFPGVTLVGVLNADAGLRMPDFRAAEQTFQLLTQVSGRAGRGERPGVVYLQTYRPNHYAIQAATNHDYATFYGQEIGFRESGGYPPFRRMVNFMIECADPALAERHTVALRRIVREQIESLGFTGMEILGPSQASIKRVNKQYRWNMAVLSRSAKRLNTLTRAARDAFHAAKPPAKVKLKVDLDPYGMA